MSREACSWGCSMSRRTPSPTVGSISPPMMRSPAGLQMHDAGAEIIDVGGESTRPGAEPVSVDDELARVIPVVEQLADQGLLVSIDTSKPEVARAAIESGARIVQRCHGLLRARAWPSWSSRPGSGWS